jgi:hypothetical protein
MTASKAARFLRKFVRQATLPTILSAQGVIRTIPFA